jgi:serine/threonine protein kinase/tetratricopeptide (TPR) repeat protein
MINGRYEIIKKIGEGRSTVFLCSDKESFNQEIALKVLTNTNNPDDLTSFRNEFLILKNLEHPNIVKVIERGTVLESTYNDIPPGSKFFTLEYFPGKDLLSVTEYSEKDLTEIIIQISVVLFYLHQSNIIYYDLKPENILIAYSNDKLQIKFIDFGFAKYISGPADNIILGTAEYIAPELLKREAFDHRIDLYSFGMLLYRVIYNKFPFDQDSEIGIYKAQVDIGFEFPDSQYSPLIINIVNKLLSKDPADRYPNSIHIIREIDQTLIKEVSKTWAPANIFIDRTEEYSQLINYLNDEIGSKVYSVKGSEGSGKSFLLNQIYNEFDEAILISYNKAKSGIGFIKEFLIKVLFNETIFNSISYELKEIFKDVIYNPPVDIIEQIKSLFSKISRNCNFIILFDNFNDLDDLTLDVLKNIIPILQVNKRKFILAENSDRELLSDGISELSEVTLTTFTDSDLNEFLEKGYFDEYPRDDVKKIILKYADLLPGNIKIFLKDILLLGILDYQSGQIKISSDENTARLLQSSQKDIYKFRISSLSPEEILVTDLTSLFVIALDQETAAVLLKLSSGEMKNIVSSLLQKNIILPAHLRSVLNFTSEGLKNYIYNNIKNKKELHSKTAQKIKQIITGFNRVELARQFELAEDYLMSFEIIKEELAAAEKISAYSYKKKFLVKYLNLPIGDSAKYEIKSDLVYVLYNLSEYGNAEILIDELLEKKDSEISKDALLTLKGTCLIGSGKIEEGKNLLNELIIRIDDKVKQLKLLAEVANAEYELNNYDEAAKICLKIINDNMSDETGKGKCYSLLGMISIFKENNLGNALNNFERAENYYNTRGLNFKVAQMEKNIGNVYNMKGIYNKAEDYWNKSLEISSSIGNLDLEAKLLLNYGVYFFEKLNFDKAIDYYNRALSIFVSLGNNSGQGMVKYNLGEIYLITCDYESAIDAVENSIKIFNNLKNLNEEMESLFLFGKLSFIIGDYQNLNTVIEVMKSKILDEKIVDKHKTHYNFLQLLNSGSKGNIDDELISYRIIKDRYRELDDKINFFFAETQLINHLIGLYHYNDAGEELNDDYFLALCSDNKLFNAEKNYILALLSLKSNTFGNSIDYLLDAFNYIDDSGITELSWKVLYKLAEIYYDRGNYSKSEEFNTFAISVLDYIFNNIKNTKIKSILMESSERKEAYKRLLMMQQKY